MIRKKNLYSRPKKPFESARIKSENELVKKYGLKNKREIWKTLAKVNYFRKRAMDLANSPIEEQEVLFGKLRAIGLKVSTTADVLGLQVENLLDRRLPTVVFKKGLANTPRHARQLVNHKKVIIGGRALNIPGYLVPTALEDTIKIKEKIKKKPVVETLTSEQVSEEAPVESNEESQNQEIKEESN